MDFIIDNYIWIIVISIILIMALIGYLAEKTDFIHENKQKKKEVKNSTEEKVKEEVEAPKNEIPSVPLESPVAEVKQNTDSLGFEDPFAMTSDVVAADKIEPVKSVENVVSSEIKAEPLFTPVDNLKFEEEFSVPDSDIQHDKVVEEQVVQEIPKTNESVVEPTANEPVQPVVEEIHDRDIYGQANTSQPLEMNSKEDEVAAPKLNENTTDEMDEWKI